VRTKSVVAVAVERRAMGKPGQKPVPGFAALEVIPDAATETLEKFLADKVKPGSHVLSDGWHGYRRLKQKGFEHTATAISKQEEPAHVLFPWVHITLSNLKRFLLGTHHKVEQKHLQHYVAEFNYRLNRRTMEPDLMMRLLRACISAQTFTYKQLIAMPELD
jgi:transposase-like protein